MHKAVIYGKIKNQVFNSLNAKIEIYCTNICHILMQQNIFINTKNIKNQSLGYSFLWWWMMMMMNCFYGMVDRRKTFSLISSWDHCQRSSPSRISRVWACAEPEFRLWLWFLWKDYVLTLETFSVKINNKFGVMLWKVFYENCGVIRYTGYWISNILSFEVSTIIASNSTATYMSNFVTTITSLIQSVFYLMDMQNQIV